jgi:hypothetical protein
VRRFATTPVEGGSIVRELPAPPGATPASLRVIAYAQERTSRHILGATMSAIAPP